MAINNDETNYVIDLKCLKSKRFGLTPHTGGAMAEAASVCLASQKHKTEVRLGQVGHFAETMVVIRRLRLSREMKDSHRDDEKATYEGAEGVALSLLVELGAIEKVSRARKGGGFDFWFVERAGTGFVFEDPNAGRLEVSGIRAGSDADVKKRLNKKVKQTKKSDKDLGGRTTYAVVVEFSRPQTSVTRR